MPEPGSIDDLPFTVLVPASTGRPIVLYDPRGALRLAVVEQGSTASLDDSWDSAGVYILLWPPNTAVDQPPTVYVGQAAQGLRKRIGRHVAGKPGWRRAVLVDRGNARFGFTSAQVGWLEGRLWRLAMDAKAVQPANKVEPRDETLPDYERPGLEMDVTVIRRVLRLLGYPLDPPGDKGHGRKKSYAVTVTDLIAAGALTVGDVLVFTDPDLHAEATVRSDGQLEILGTNYASPSAAAAAVRGRPTNGWADWALVGANGPVTLMTLRARLSKPSEAASASL